MDKCYEMVKINPAGFEPAGSTRFATAYCTIPQLTRVLGLQHAGGDDNLRSTAWYLETPRGRVTVQDYWANEPDQQTIAATNHRAAFWAAKYLTKHGIEATLDLK